MDADVFMVEEITCIILVTPTHVITARLEKPSFTWWPSGTKFPFSERADFR